ncbi:GNAT family N-acetyltransferase [Candidatus Dojkabacteria bacterium]|nr:GNAT family N-acetyltransferase [Candidatus Dojkabacteria bacterium]
MENTVKIITVDQNNIDQEHICCAIGNDKANQSRALTKKNWMKERFKDGLVFKRLNDRGKIFIEYMPIEKAWKPIIGKNFMVINCLWVSGKFKGKGISTELLNECINDAKKRKMDGIVVVSSTKVKPFLTDKRFYLHKGFEVIDSAPPYFELLALKFNKNAQNPEFTKNAKQGNCDDKEGFTFIYSNQCPFMEEYVELLSNICRSRKIPCNVNHLKDYKEAQLKGSPFGTLGIYYNGEFKTHELMSEKTFEKFIKEVV